MNIKRLPVENNLVVHKSEKIVIKPEQNDLSKYLENLTTTFYEVNSEGRYTYLSPSWKEMFGFEVEESLGKHFLTFIKNEQAEELDKIVSQVRDNSNGSFVFSIVVKGELKWYKCAFTTSYNENGKRTGYFGSFTDVTYLKDAEISANENNKLLQDQQKVINTQLEELQTKNKELQKYIASNLELENFAYIASHDLKAPLRSVMSFSQLLKKNYYEKLDERGQKYLGIISEASENMLQLIDDLLRYTSASTKELYLTKCDIQKVLEEHIYGLENTLHNCQVSIELQSLPTDLVVDRELIHHLFSHLIDNAIKFKCPKKGVSKIKVEAKEMQDSWHFTISDNGQGMPQNFADKAFELFKKQKTIDSNKGTGIGLSIAKSIVNLHGGKIWIVSNEGDGTNVFFTISKDLRK